MKNKPANVLIVLILFLFAITEPGITRTLSTSQLPPRNQDSESNQQQPFWLNNMDIGIVAGDQYKNKSYKDHKVEHYNDQKSKDRIKYQQGNPKNNRHQYKDKTESIKN